MRYKYLKEYPTLFLKVTGLGVAEFEALVKDVLPPLTQAEGQGLERRDRQRGS
jgi:hypothetical protein